MLQMLKNAWTQILITFDVKDPIVRSGKPYALPESFSDLDPEAKMRATICNLFTNLQQPIEEIARAYEIRTEQVISILLTDGLIKDQRRNQAHAVKGGRRATDH